ncbi:MAG: mevalonate kinase [Candidatus Bathyarchaeota archaeon]|nr:MAG: mevalonate kinase [Candidatus Bathyarchaeota archaeon]
MAVEATAPGKAILFGEHSVVYRGPAVVLAIDRRARVVARKRDDDRIFFDAMDLGFSGYFTGETYVPLQGESWRGKRLQAFLVAARKTMEHLGTESGLGITLRSDIPVAAGLGSSAALSVATVASVGGLLGGDLSQEEICELAYEGEKVVHGTPSGVDNNISTYGGVLRYEKDVGIERFELDGDLPFVIGDSMRKRSTKRLVDRVRMLREREPELVEGVLDSIVLVSESGLAALKANDLHRLGDLMNVNHGLLSSLGVSIAKLDMMVHSSRGAGAYGAKLTGAGGGGCMIALSDEASIEKINRAILRCRGEPHVVSVSYEGAKTREVD